MKKMKRIQTVILAAAAACGLSSCGIRAFGFSQENLKEDTVSLSSVSEMEIDMTCADLTVRLGDENKLYYAMNERLVPEISQTGGRLSVKSPKKTGMNFSINEKNRMEITLDQKTLSALNISLTSGDIDIDGFDLAGSITTTSGDISVCNAENGGNLALETTSGDIRISGSRFARISKEQTSGDLEMNRVTADRISFASTSGDTSVRSSRIGEIGIDCTSGDIELELLGSENDYNYDCACFSGSVRIAGENTGRKYQKDNSTSDTLKADTTSGNISVTFFAE